MRWEVLWQSVSAAVFWRCLFYKFGSDWIDVVLPPAAMGPVVALIGLELSGTASKEGLLEERSSRKMRSYFCDVGSCGIWFDHVSEVSVRYPDPDRRDRRICGSAGVWNLLILRK